MEDIVLVEKFLADELSLSKKEVGLYLNLIKYGPSTILELSEITGINRATTHVNIENLTQKGLVTQMRKGRGSRRLIMAEPIEKLPIIFKERKMRIETAENQLPFITDNLANLKKEHRSGDSMEIRRYTGKDEVKLIYNEVLKTNELRTYANPNEIIKVFPANSLKFAEAHKKNKNMRVWEIMGDSKETREYIKLMDKERFFYRLAIEKLILPSMDYLIFDGKIAMVEASQGLVSGVLIENSNFYKASVSIHKFVWNYLGS
ncbi:MAG: helix-turn-helix domain-containing protein [Promethearchaeota archaeon]